MLYDNLLDIARSAAGDAADALGSRGEGDPACDSYAWPVLEDGKRLVGALVLTRTGGVAKMSSQTRNTAGFVASTIEHLLEKSFDAVTGLMTWPGFEAATDAAQHAAPGNGSVLYMDMDQLHVLNDTFGREHGDQALREIGGILRSPSCH